MNEKKFSFFKCDSMPGDEFKEKFELSRARGGTPRSVS